MVVELDMMNDGIGEGTTSTLESTQQNSITETKKGENVSNNKVAFYKLFSFADSTDKALMIIGSIGAIANGVAMPLMAILLGDLVNAFGQNQNTNQVVDAVSQVRFSLHIPYVFSNSCNSLTFSLLVNTSH